MKAPAPQAARIALFILFGGVFAAFPPDSTAESKKPAPVPMELTQPAAASPWLRYSNWTTADWKDYNTLTQTASPAYAPPPVLAGLDALNPISDDPKNGEKLAFDRTRGGSCVACHIMGKTTPALPGTLVPICPLSAPGCAPTSGCSISYTTRAASIRAP
jgi:sulfur-oxidizing protein SoxA